MNNVIKAALYTRAMLLCMLAKATTNDYFGFLFIWEFLGDSFFKYQKILIAFYLHLQSEIQEHSIMILMGEK